MNIGKRILEFIFLLGFALFQTIIFFAILGILERTNIFMIYVSKFNSNIIYSTELGSFFFSLILISDILADLLRLLIKRYYKFHESDFIDFL